MLADRLARARQALELRLADGADVVLGRRDPLIPPRRRNFVGNSDFRATGDEFLTHFQECAGLAGSDRVLDIGCGIGRMARVLVPVLTPPRGSYDGFDVVASGVAWCTRHYTDTPVPFRFTHVDLHHPDYNPGGTEDPAAFAFPYPDGAFDLALATSVFTHLLDDTADHYLAQAARVLAPGGRLFSTWFLVQTEVPITPGRAIVSFAAHAGAAQVADPRSPTAAVAYPEPWVRDRFAAYGLEISRVDSGSWRGVPGRTSQDIIVAERR